MDFPKPSPDKPYSTRIVVTAKQDAKTWEGMDLCLGTPARVFSEVDLPADFTCYDAKVKAVSPLTIQIDPTKVFTHEGYAPWHFGAAMVDLCPGTGAMSFGIEAMGGSSVAFVDSNPLACEHLRRNHGTKVIQGSIGNDEILRSVHEKIVEAKCEGFTILAGFPCQPFSRQGLGHGEEDRRFKTYHELIRAVILLGPQATLFECVMGARTNHKVQLGLTILQELLGWDKAEIESELSKQWPMKRHRWFVFLTHPEWIACMKEHALEQNLHLQVEDVLGRFYLEEEVDCTDLYLTEYELACYQDVRLGNDTRVLTGKEVCATLLHSYGSPLAPCPCGCRSRGLAFSNLIDKGLRGYYVACEKGSKARYLHHQELATLLGISTDMRFGRNEKENLCLLGLVASPLQVVDAFGNLLYAAAHTAHNLHRIHPRILMQCYKDKVLHRHKQTLATSTKNHSRHSIHIIEEGLADYTIQVSSKVNHEMIAQAERIATDWGSYIRVDPAHDEKNIQTPTHDHTCIYINRPTKRSKIEQDTGAVALILQHQGHKQVAIGNKGDFLFQFLDKCHIHSRITTDSQGSPIPPDTRIWASGTYQAFGPHSFPHLPSIITHLQGQGPPQPGANARMGDQGLTDKQLDEIMINLLHSAGYSSKQYWSPHNSLLLLEQNQQSKRHEHIRQQWPNRQPLFGILWDEGHWISFKAHIQEDILRVQIFDGLERPPVDYVEFLFENIQAALDCKSIHIEVQAHVRQTFGQHCGTIAVLHLQHAMGLPTTLTEQHAYNWHRQIADYHANSESTGSSISSTLSITLTGEGPESLNILKQLLTDKGVPTKAVQQRAENLTAKLGQHTIDRVLHDKNPWASLKQEASRPGIMFKILTDSERTAYIESRAQTKHGAQVKNYKQKKQQHKQQSREPLTLQPELLEINPKHFQDTEGKPVQQIAFDRVGAEQTGIAICTAEMAAPFIAQAKSISTGALGLLMTDLPPQEHIDRANIQRLKFPAKYTSTQEPILVFGGLLELGDKGITRVLQGPTSKPDTIETFTIRIQVFRDQLQMPWGEFTSSPVKHLVYMIPALTLCKGIECGTGCRKFHSPIDQQLETVITEVWGRHYSLITGGRKEAAEAEMFAVNMRVPEAAIDSILTDNPVGIYTEAKAADAKSPHPKYAVIWLARATYTEAAHQAKLCTFTLSLVRARQRYGVRVHKTSEEKAWMQLKPDSAFTPLKISCIFEIAPLPHGTQRKAVQQLLSDWNWTGKPLQPGKGTIDHMSWRIGADTDPPAPTMQAFGEDVLIYRVKSYEAPQRQQQAMLTSAKTQYHIKKAMHETATSSTDPWTQEADPWAKYKNTNTQAAASSNQTRLDELSSLIKQDLHSQLSQELKQQQQGDQIMTDPQQEDRIHKLESQLQDMNDKQSQMHQWLADAGNQIRSNQQEVQNLRQEMQTEMKKQTDSLTQGLHQAVTSVKAEISAELKQTFSENWNLMSGRLEALLEKRQRHDHSEDWLRHTECENRSTRMSGNKTRPTFFGHHLIRILVMFHTWGLGMSQYMPHLSVHQTPEISAHWVAGDTKQFQKPVNCSEAPFQAHCEHSTDHPNEWGHPVCCYKPSQELLSLEVSFHLGRRIGEALHPGPCTPDTCLITIGQSNPSGLRGKHLEAAQLGPGIWSYAETHLTKHTASTFQRALRALGRQADRQIRINTGNPAALRANSRWAGTWSGVLQHSDFPCREIQTSWPPELYNTGRLMMVRNIINGTHITTATCYGYPRNPTWPQGHILTNEMLKPITQQLVLGQSGIRLILGDMNQQVPGSLDEQKIWQAHGWISAQTFATEHLGHDWQPTCGSNGEVDQIWMSPEAAQLCRCFTMKDIFSGHTTIAVHLQLPQNTIHQWTWPLPSEIPWHKFTVPFDPPTKKMPTHEADPTEALKAWGRHFEQHVEQQASTHGVDLPSAWQGRASRTAPVRHVTHTPLAKASRQGEITLTNDAVGLAVRLWYKQARRIQSLQHAAAADKQTPSAQLYRAELWSSIVHASGFTPDFTTWWSHRTPEYDTSPTDWPATMPGLDDIKQIFAEFNAHFRKFESWHNAQRMQLLKAKHDQGLKQLFQDLRPPRKDSIDVLWHDKTHPVLAKDIETKQLHVEGELEPTPNSVWTLDDKPVQISNFDGVICTVDDITQVDESSVLQQRVFSASIDELQNQLLEHWRPKWKAATPIPQERWDRITAFVKRFLPRCDFQLDPITLPQWKRAVRKLKCSAARGTDGVSREDLLNMTDQHQIWLLTLLDHIEMGKQDWPKQWLTGIIHAISKHDHAHTPGDYRPIHLFVITYRLWASIRTKQTLRMLQAYMPEAAYGFLPGRETAQVWMAIQAWVEHAVNFDLPLCGISTDLQKCFNNIERPQIFLIAEHLGISERITLPWKSFLGSFERRFCIRNTVGVPETSDRGVAEGDPLSILAMVQINWCHHAYLEAYHPKISCRSFVDNLCLMTQQVDSLIEGMAATVTCLELWGLATDRDKTYVWATDSKGRQLLRAWDYAVQYDARELGGSLTLCKAVRNKHFKQRGFSLEERWQQLYRSLAPISQKLLALYMVFWPAALHGAAAVLVSDFHIHELRLRAMKALRFSRAGTNALLKLSLYGKALSDPGYFQHWLVFHTFQRLLRKCGDLLHLWRIHLRYWQGKVTPGPFCKILLCAQQLGWSFIEPPVFSDHFGALHDLLNLDSAQLDALLEDAWLQYVATTCKHKTMAGLVGLSSFLTRLDHQTLPAIGRSRVSALQSGAFMTTVEQAKFDPSKKPHCTLCNEPDNRRHWLNCPRFSVQRIRARIDPQCLRDEPDCVVQHLLVPKLPEEKRMRQFLHSIPRNWNFFRTDEHEPTNVDLFTDGACRRPFKGHQVAAWAIYHAQQRLVLAAAPLAGLQQSIDRAELTAILGAVTWANEHDRNIRLWSDAKALVGTMEMLLQHPDYPLPDANYDLWSELPERLKERQHLATSCRWVPSHLNLETLEDDFEIWLHQGNDTADKAATAILDNLDPLYTGLQQALEQKYTKYTELISRLRTFYFLVAEADEEKAPLEQSNGIEEHVEALVSAEPLEDTLPLSWRSLCPESNSRFPTQFFTDVLQQLIDWERLPGQLRVWSDAELVFFFLQDVDRKIPVRTDASQWHYRPLSAYFERPTFAKLLRVFKDVFDEIGSCFGLDFRVASVSVTGFTTKVKGFQTSIPPGVTDPGRAQLLEFVSKREIRHSRDLARPC